MRTIVLIGLALAAPAPRLAAQTLSDSAVDAWRADLTFLRASLPQVHPDPFRWVGAARWDSAAARFGASLPSRQPVEAWVGLQDLVALLGDGHTGINPLWNASWPVHYFPFDLESFPEGEFVTAAAPEYGAAVGARVVAVGGMPVDEALRRVGAGVPQENEWWVRAWAPSRLSYVELVRGAGITTRVQPVRLTLERDGRTFTIDVNPAGLLPRGQHGARDGIDRSAWVRMAEQAGRADAQPDRPYWFEWVPEGGMLYVCYRAVVDWPGETNAAFWTRVFAAADSLPVGRLVIDLRDNTGGNNFFNLAVIRGIVQRPALDRPDRLYVLIGRRTFSAAMNCVNELERYTRATFVGEPTGSRPNMFGDHEALVLPQTGITVMVSRVWWQTMNPRDRRQFVPPRLYAPRTAESYRAGRDPALEAVLADTLPPLAERLRGVMGQGDPAAVEAFVRAEAEKPANRYASAEAAVNSAGYALLNDGQIESAIMLFELNTRVYPASANTWDSLGEALVRANRHPDAIAAFRRALAVDPAFGSSRAWLERLGAR